MDCGIPVNTYTDKPVCHECRRERLGLDPSVPHRRGRPDRQRAYWRARVNRQILREIRMSQQTITVTFPSRAAYEAALAAVAEKATEAHDDRAGPSVDQLDTREALRALEGAR